MPKAKMLLKGAADKRKGKMAKPQPSTADEYLEAGVDFEEAGEKWRGGDAAKSARFFVRAITCYEEALAKFPRSFDLAYNKCRVQYELTQYPKLLAQLPGTLMELLEVALESSRYALTLKQDNAEVLYTTAQILSSLEEAVIASSGPTNHQPLPLLEESLDLFQRCLALQEYLYTESQSQAEAAMDTSDPDLEDGGVSLGSDTPTTSASAPAEQVEQWASIVEPVTHETLLDTVVAQLEVLTLVCALRENDTRILSFIEEYSTPLLELKLPTYLKDASPDTRTFSMVAAATFVSALAEANFQSERIDALTYWEKLQSAWASVDISQSAEALVAAAEALVSYNQALRHSLESSHSQLSSRWKALTSAQDLLIKASQLPNVEKLAKIYLLRGDVDLLRFQLGSLDGAPETARKSQAVLCRNAEKFYRGANGLAAGDETDIVVEAKVKEGLAKALGGQGDAVRHAAKEVGEKAARGLLVDCWEDGLVERAQLEGWGL